MANLCIGVRGNSVDAGAERVHLRAGVQSQARASPTTARAVRLLTAIVAAICPIRHASALPVLLPDYFLSLGCTGSPPVQTPGQARCEVSNASESGFGVARGITAPPAVSADAQYTGLPLGSVIGVASLRYSFAVKGPSNTFVGVIIDAMLNAFADGGADAAAALNFDDINIGVVCEGINCPGALPSFAPIHKTVIVNTDFVNSIQISVSAVAGNGSDAHAFADPFLSIDPSTPNADQFTLVFSTGIVNEPIDGGGNVPEPTTLALLGIGLAGLGFSRRLAAACGTPRCS